MFVIRDNHQKTFYDLPSKKFVSKVETARGTKTHAAAKIVLDQLRREGYKNPMNVIQTIEKGT